MTFDAGELLRALARHDVAYVTIGGLAVPAQRRRAPRQGDGRHFCNSTLGIKTVLVPMAPQRAEAAKRVRARTHGDPLEWLIVQRTTWLHKI